MLDKLGALSVADATRLRARIEEAFALKLGDWVDRLELNVAYGETLSRPERVDLEVVRARDTRGFVALLEVVTAVL